MRDLNRMNKSVERLAISLTSVSALTAVHDSITDNPQSPEELRTRVKEAAPSMGGGVKSHGGPEKRRGLRAFFTAY